MSSAVARTAARPSVCVLDARLLLEPLGLTLACRLARQAETWLVRRLWSLLDNDSFYQRWPAELAPGCTVEHARRLAAWRTAWLDGQLNQRFFWVGDARYESVLPCDFDAALRDRFERLVIELDPLADEASSPRLGVLDQCARDALALAAALENENPLILTLAGPDTTPPALVRLAQQLEVFQVVTNRDGDDLMPESIRKVVAPLIPFGLRVAAVHVVAPDAAVFPADAPPLDTWEESKSDTAGALWSHAGLVWQPFAVCP